MNEIPNKKLTDKDLVDIVSRVVSENPHIDDAELYQGFLIGLAGLLTTYLGGQVESGGHNPVDKNWQVIIGHTDEVPAGNIFSDYDRGNEWPDEEGSELERTLPSMNIPMMNIIPVDKMIEMYGVWGEHPDHPRSDWQYAVANGDSNLGYWEWVANRME
jgi:hypothetical protein